MSAIEAAIPNAGKVDAGKLAAIPAEILARYVVDAARPWWRRRPCIHALRGRVPEAFVDAMLERIRDPSDTAEVRIALLELLGDREALLPWLRSQPPEQPYGMHEAILSARATLGDLSAVPALVTLACDAWSGRRTLGQRSLDLVVGKHGLAAVLDRVGDRPEDRTFRVRMAQHDPDAILAALADPEIGVARTAAELAIANEALGNETLIDRVVTESSVDARLWALYILDRRGHEIRELWHAIDAPRVEIAGLPETVRRAILREYPGEARTDPR